MSENLTWCKEVIVEGKHTLDFPPVNKQKEDGSWIINYNLLPSEMTKDGYTQWTDEQIEAWHEQYDPEPEPYVRQRCTKYQLVNCLKTYFPELLTTLRTAYANSADLQFYWNTVNDLDRNNTDFKTAVRQLGIREEELDAVFNAVC